MASTMPSRQMVNAIPFVGSYPQTVFSFGVLMHEMITGESPFRNFKQIGNGELPPLPSEKACPKVVALMKQCTLFDPSKRPTVDELQEEILRM